MLYRNTSKVPFEMVIRMSADADSNKTFACAPGATMEGPDGYADVFVMHGLVPAGDIKAEPVADVVDEGRPKKGR